MIINLEKYEFKIDKFFKTISFINKKNLKQNDIRDFEIEFYENGKQLNIENFNIEVRWVKPDKKFVDMTGTAITKNANVATFKLNPQCTKVPGINHMEISISKDGYINSSWTIDIYVEPSILTGSAGVSKNVSNLLDELTTANTNANNTYNKVVNWSSTHQNVDTLITDVNNIKKIGVAERLNDCDSKISQLNNTKANNTKVEDLQQQINNIVLNAGGDSNNEVVQARAVFKTLNDRLSSCKINIEEYCRRTLVMGQINGIDHTLNQSTNKLTNGIILTATDDIEFSVQDGYKYVYFTWKTDSEISTDSFIFASGWKTTTETIEKGTHFSVQIAKIDGSPCSLSDVNAISLKEVNSEIENLKKKPTLYHVLGTGQSLSVGAEGNPSLTKLCPLEYVGKAFVFNGGARPIDGENFNIGEQGDLSDSSTMYLMAAHEEDHKLHIDDNKDGDRKSVV